MKSNVISIQELKEAYRNSAIRQYNKKLCELSPNQVQYVIADVIKNQIIKSSFEKSREYYSNKRIAIYFSMEFLIGRVVLDALVNTGLKEMTSKIFAEEGIDINILEDVEDMALGNGGLGRLAACFIESAATTRYPLFGYGLYYKYGLFKQQFDENKQKEIPDDWTSEGDPWFERREAEEVVVNFKNTRVTAVPYVLPIIGYNKDTEKFDQNVFPLTLWKAEPIIGETDEIAEKISDFLYPDDSKDEGKKLRISQEYFFVSATMQRLVNLHLKKHGTLDNFEEYYCFQMNDTHPVLACIEFIRLMEENGYSFDEASKKAKKCFAYTNHTILPEALESWDMNLMRETIPESCIKIIQNLNLELINTCIKLNSFKLPDGQPNWDKVRNYELFTNWKVHMSRIACYIGFAVNGVAEIHSEIIKQKTLMQWYDIYPEKFTNCTNGVTPRRWIRGSNPAIAEFLDAKVGSEWITNLTKIESLWLMRRDSQTLVDFAETKMRAKKSLAAYILKHEGIEIDFNSVFDCQVKRIHEYKRQLMNGFRILYIYESVKSGRITDLPNITFIIGGKAASGYYRAKKIIEFLKDIQNMVNNDPEIDGRMKVVFVTNFNVSYGEKIYAAADFSEQISTAGTEASGTGNMKFMMNGAPTIGTMDGANIEIVREAGRENNYIFGASVKELRELSYNPSNFMQYNFEMKQILPYLVNGRLGNQYYEIIDWLRQEDKYFVMYDLPSYIDVSLRAFSDWNHEKQTGDFTLYTAKGLANTARSAYFSSDRTIKEYAERIWRIEPI